MCTRFPIGALFAVVALGASANVVQVTPNGFLVRHEVTVNAPPAKVYEALVGQVGSWWSSAHTY
ncbi:MAG: ATPase, partial [Proteobacteria bacterium]